MDIHVGINDPATAIRGVNIAIKISVQASLVIGIYPYHQNIETTRVCWGGGEVSRVEWGKTHTFWKAGAVSQSIEDNDLIPFPSDTSNICLQNIGETAP